MSEAPSMAAECPLPLPRRRSRLRDGECKFEAREKEKRILCTLRTCVSVCVA